MASAQLLVNASYRDIPLYQAGVLREIDASSGFLEASSPMPVGTMLLLSPLDNPRQRLPALVTMVVEACRTATPTESAPPAGMRLSLAAGPASRAESLAETSAARPAAEPSAEAIEMEAEYDPGDCAETAETAGEDRAEEAAGDEEAFDEEAVGEEPAPEEEPEPTAAGGEQPVAEAGKKKKGRSRGGRRRRR